MLYSACNFHGPGLRGQRASQAPFSAFVNLKGNIGLLLYKLRERQSGGPGQSQGALPAAAVPVAPSPARGREQGMARPRAPSPPGRGGGNGVGDILQAHPPNSWAAGVPRLASSKATLATCLLAASNKWHIPGASPAGEREKERLEGLRSSLEVGGKLFPCCLKFHHLKRLPLSALSCWSHSTLNTHQASTKARAALFLKSQGHLAGLGKTWGQIPYKH